MSSKQIFVYPGLVIVTFQMSGGGEFDQILIADIIFCQEGEVVAFVVDVGFFLEPGPIGDINFNADDRLDVVFFAGGVKINDPIHGAVVGQCNRAHAVLFGELDHILDLGHAVQERVVGMSVEMRKFHE